MARAWTKYWMPLVLVVALVAAGCGGDDDDSSAASNSSTTTTAASGVEGDITVSAAASLTQAFATIGDDFEPPTPAANATFNFGSSSTLETQIEQGAPAD